jgi:hypothetical protein
VRPMWVSFREIPAAKGCSERTCIAKEIFKKTGESYTYATCKITCRRQHDIHRANLKYATCKVERPTEWVCDREASGQAILIYCCGRLAH